MLKAFLFKSRSVIVALSWAKRWSSSYVEAGEVIMHRHESEANEESYVYESKFNVIEN